jgi:S1-C subfamily serine protease
MALWFMPLLGPWVGSALVAINWWNLRRKIYALCALAFIPCQFLALSWFIPEDAHVITTLIAAFTSWLVLLAAPQIWFVHKHHGTRFTKRRWLVPIGIGLIIGAAMPKITELLESLYASDQSTAPTHLASVSSRAQAVKELTVEEVAKTNSNLVYPLEVSWKQTSYLVFTSKNAVRGSAVVIATKGNDVYLATNWHVVGVPSDATDIKRTLVDNTNQIPFVVVTAPIENLDLAVIKITSDTLIGDYTIPTESLENIEVGQECVAIGNSLGMGISVTTGIVSRFDEAGSFVAIRTSAPISPGNSGGGLFRRKDGKLIGVTTAAAKADGAQNVNIALPIEYVKRLQGTEPTSN